MKKILFSFFAFLIFFFAVGFILYVQDNRGEDTKNTDENTPRLVVAGTFFPVYDIVRFVGGDAVEPILVVPPGGSVHTFDATPKDVARLEKATLLFAIGNGIDDWAQGLAQQAELITLDRDISLQNNDPHYWLSPGNAARMAETVANELGKKMPERTLYFTERAATFKNALTAAEETWRASLATVTLSPVINFHDAFFYFADYFGIKIAGHVEEFPGKEPTPQQIVALKKIVETEAVEAMFIEPQLSREGAEILASDLGLALGMLDEAGGTADRDSYIKLITFNIESIVHAHQ